MISKIDVTKPKRIWYKHKEQIIDLLMLSAASLIVLIMTLVLVLAK